MISFLIDLSTSQGSLRNCFCESDIEKVYWNRNSNRIRSYASAFEPYKLIHNDHTSIGLEEGSYTFGSVVDFYQRLLDQTLLRIVGSFLL